MGDAPPTTEYWVPNNNWTKELLGQSSMDPEVKIPTIDYLINVDATRNPALGCNKGFEASYQCGKHTNPSKILSIDPEALGKTARFNCTAEAAVCTPLKLTLDDTGKLTLTNTTSGAKLWSSDEISGGKVTPPTATALEKYQAPKGKYPRNYLLPGEFLDMSGNEWIGSPSGKYRLMMSSNGLQVVYNNYGCGTLMNMGGTESTFKSDSGDAATLFYQLPPNFTQNIGQMGYINNGGQLQIFTDQNPLFDSSYETIGKYNILGSSLGTEIYGKTASDCQTKCNADNTCAGFVFDTERTMCQLKNKNVYQSARIINNDYEYQLRNRKVNNDVSCPQEVTNEDSSFWQNATKANEPMLSTTKCGLAAYTEAERKAVAAEETKLTTAVDTDYKSMVNTLRDKYKLLKNHLLSTDTDTETAGTNLKNKREELGLAMGDKKTNEYKQLQAMNEDTDLNMMSQNYRHIMWSILAIVIIIATMKIAK